MASASCALCKGSGGGRVGSLMQEAQEFTHSTPQRAFCCRTQQEFTHSTSQHLFRPSRARARARARSAPPLARANPRLDAEEAAPPAPPVPFLPGEPPKPRPPPPPRLQGASPKKPKTTTASCSSAESTTTAVSPTDHQCTRESVLSTVARWRCSRW